MNEKRKILFVSGSLNRGGAQRVISILANAYAKKYWDVHMAVLLNDEIGYELEKGIKVHGLVRRENQLLNAGKWIMDLRNHLEDQVILKCRHLGPVFDIGAKDKLLFGSGLIA